MCGLGPGLGGLFGIASRDTCSGPAGAKILSGFVLETSSMK